METCMRICFYRKDLLYSNIVWQQGINATNCIAHFVGSNILQVHMCKKLGSVHTGIGTPTTQRAYGLPETGR